VIYENVRNEVNYALLENFDYLKHPDPGSNMKFEGFVSKLDDYKRKVAKYEERVLEEKRRKAEKDSELKKKFQYSY